MVGEGICRRINDATTKAGYPRAGEKAHIDLWMVAFRQFFDAGVTPEHFSLFDVCTAETPLLYSHRRDKGNTGGMAAYLRIL